MALTNKLKHLVGKASRPVPFEIEKGQVRRFAAAIGEEKGTIEDVLEPYLIQQGFVIRTPRGRMATRACFVHFGLTPPKSNR